MTPALDIPLPTADEQDMAQRKLLCYPLLILGLGIGIVVVKFAVDAVQRAY